MKLNPVVVNPLTVSKYEFVKSSKRLLLMNTLFQTKGIISTSGIIVNVMISSQREVSSSSSLRSQKALNKKPAPMEKKLVATRLAIALDSPL